MTATTMSSHNWTAAEIDLALIHIRTALTSLQRHPRPIDIPIDHAVNEARQLESYLEHNPRACTAEALACCRELIAVQQT